MVKVMETSKQGPSLYRTNRCDVVQPRSLTLRPTPGGNTESPVAWDGNVGHGLIASGTRNGRVPTPAHMREPARSIMATSNSRLNLMGCVVNA